PPGPAAATTSTSAARRWPTSTHRTPRRRLNRLAVRTARPPRPLVGALPASTTARRPRARPRLPRPAPPRTGPAWPSRRPPRPPPPPPGPRRPRRPRRRAPPPAFFPPPLPCPPPRRRPHGPCRGRVEAARVPRAARPRGIPAQRRPRRTLASACERGLDSW